MPRTNYCTSNVNRRTDGRTEGRTDGMGIAIALSQIGWLGAKNRYFGQFDHFRWGVFDRNGEKAHLRTKNLSFEPITKSL